VLEEANRVEAKIEWSALREAETMFARIAAEPNDARDLLEQWSPILFADQETLEREATENNAFG
jgi:hypothetical protein